MTFSFDLAGASFRFDASAPLDISIPLDFNGTQPSAFYLEPAASRSVSEGSFIGDTRQGGSCNCATVTLNPHGNGTHTECVGHITDERVNVGQMLRASLLPATVISVRAASGSGVEGVDDGNDMVITRPAIARAIEALDDAPHAFFTALVIRTLPNDASKRTGAYSGSNPCYISIPAMRLVRELGVEHLLVDLPSVDREDDGGALAAHRIFWDAPERGTAMAAPFNARTITEMIYVPDAVADGRYLLDLQIPNFLLDAAPSRPLLYPILNA
jgi:hypothetical protein